MDEHNREEAYRIYISKSLQLNPQNKWLEKDFYSLLNPKAEDDRTSNEIALDVMKRAGLHFED